MLKRVKKLFIQYQYDTRKIAPWKIALRKIVPYPNPNPNPNLWGTCWGQSSGKQFSGYEIFHL